jgi:hypothetical protein
MSRVVSIYDTQGNRLYMNLVDDGSGLYRFASGWGFITEYQVRVNNWKVVLR